MRGLFFFLLSGNVDLKNGISPLHTTDRYMNNKKHIMKQEALNLVEDLNNEDFESLNFTREFATMSTILETPCEVYKNETLNLQIAHYKELNKISICTIDFSKNKTKSSWDENQINLISIKNKSELQYILNRLGFSQADA